MDESEMFGKILCTELAKKACEYFNTATDDAFYHMDESDIYELSMELEHFLINKFKHFPLMKGPE